MRQSANQPPTKWRRHLLFFIYCIIISAFMMGAELLVQDFAYRTWRVEDLKISLIGAFMIALFSRPISGARRPWWQWCLIVFGLCAMAFIVIGMHYASKPETSPPLLSYWLLACLVWVIVFLFTVWMKRWFPDPVFMLEEEPQQRGG